SFGINSVAFSPDGKQILSGSQDTTIKLWELSGKLLHTFEEHSFAVNSVAFSPDGKQFLSGSKDKTIKLWDLSGKSLHTFEGHSSYVASVAFNPNGKQILSGSSDNTIKLWDISGKLLHTFKGHTSSVNSVAFSPDGKFIVSGSSDTTIKIWDVEKRTLVATLIAFKDGEGLVYTPDGKFDYTSGKVKDYVSYRKGSEFIDLSDMFDHFYEKGLLEKVLAGDADNDKQDTKSLDEKFKNRPLIKVRNIDPQKIIKAEEATRSLRFAVTDQGSGISEVMVFVNGRLLSSNWQDFSEDLTIDVPLVAGVNKVEIKAYNKDNIPITHSMELTREAALDEVLDKPDLYLLAVGINEYKESKLKFSVNDAKDFTSLIEKKSKGLFGNVIVKSLLDKDASKRNIKEAIADIKLKAKAKDVVMLYFSGHGNTAIKVNPLPNENPKLFYFVPSDFGWGDTNMDSESVARNQGVDADYINKSISSMLPHKVVLILDACQSGDVQLAMKSGDKTKLARHQMERLANGTGRFILTSSAGNELSREIATLGHGVFTYVLLQALQEADTDKSGDISLREIGRYIEDKFEEKTKPYLKDIIQSPSPLIQLGRDSASARVNDFPLVKTR
ncbi:MAG TPA: caspase family protein, partial [Leptospiraceae bacterium]|nr:caspase family protein [Leptospiraceae bacterium]